MDERDILEQKLESGKFYQIQDEIIVSQLFHCKNCSAIEQQNCELKRKLEQRERNLTAIKEEYNSYIVSNENSYALLNAKYKKLIEDILPKIESLSRKSN